jgi:hypothetical protein
LSSKFFYLCCQKILQPEFIHRSGKLSPSAEPPGRHNQAAGCISLGKSWDPLPGQNVKSQMSPQLAGINNPLVPKTDTQETENLDKAISLDQEGANMGSLRLSRYASTKFLTVAPPYIPDAVVPVPHLGFVQVKGSQSFLIG